jgi:26S proteasome regulatory subunit N1
MSNQREETIEVRKEDMSEEAKKKQDEKDKQPDSLKPDNQQGSLPGAREEPKEMTEEDRLLKEKLEELVKNLGEALAAGGVDTPQIHALLDTLSNEIQTSTSSMTSVPKPLKFLRPHYDFFKTSHEKLVDSVTKVRKTASLCCFCSWCCRDDFLTFCLLFR